jgi:hypothetical protein
MTRLHTCFALTLICAALSACKERDSVPQIPAEYAQVSAAELFAQGMKAHAAADYKKSSMLFGYAATKDPSNQTAFFNHACALALLGDKEGAVRSLESAAKLNPSWVAQNLNDPDLASIQQDSRVKELKKSGDTVARDVVGRKICRRPTGPADTAQIEITLNADKTIAGSGSRTGASLNLELESGTWELVGPSLIVTLRFRGTSYGPDGSQMKKETSTISVDHETLLKSTADCFEIQSL